MAVDTATVIARYCDAMHVAVGEAPAYVAGLAGLALQKAEEDIREVLGEAGYSPADLVGWPGHDAAVTMQAMYWILALGAVLDSGANGRVVKALMDTLDQRASLKEAALFDAAGEWIVPGGEKIGHGKLKIQDDEAFRDSRTGRWRDW